MLANQEDLAQIMTAEQDNPLTEACGEVLYAASFIEWFAEEAKRVYGYTIPGHQPDERLIVTKVHLADTLEKGTRVRRGGKAHALGGNFFEPTGLVGVTPEMRVVREETFGPLTPLFRFSDEAEVVRQANDTELGLAGYFYTRDLGRVLRVGEVWMSTWRSSTSV